MKRKAKDWKECLKRGSPTILTFIGVAGVIATAISSATSTVKAIEILKEKNEENECVSKSEIFSKVVPIYTPTIIFGGITIMCIFEANVLNKKKQAALMSAYALINNSYRDYKRKVKELYGEETHRRIIESMTVEKAKDTHITAPTFLTSATLDFEDENEKKRVFYDSFSKRYFESTIEKVLEAEYHLNRNFTARGYSCLNEFYEFLGIDKRDYGDELGWSVEDELYWIDFNHYKTRLKDEIEVFVIDIVFEPTNEWKSYIYV